MKAEKSNWLLWIYIHHLNLFNTIARSSTMPNFLFLPFIVPFFSISSYSTRRKENIESEKKLYYVAHVLKFPLINSPNDKNKGSPKKTYRTGSLHVCFVTRQQKNDSFHLPENEFFYLHELSAYLFFKQFLLLVTWWNSIFMRWAHFLASWLCYWWKGAEWMLSSPNGSCPSMTFYVRPSEWSTSHSELPSFMTI